MEWEIVGYIAGLLLAVALIPQVIKVWKRKSAKDISIIWTLILMTGLFLWVTYAIKNSIIPLALFTTVEFILSFTLFLFKLKYK